MDSRTLVFCVLAACAGPRPEVGDVSVAPGPPGMQRVSLALHNDSRGHGEVDLQITLHDAAGHKIKASHTVEIKAHQLLQLWVDVPAPAGVYAADVKAEYPD